MILFNLSQLATYAEARALRDLLNSDTRFARCQALPGDDEGGSTPTVNANFPWLPPIVPQLGIHRLVWDGGPGGFAEPANGDSKFLHFRFANGRDGINVGLCIDLFRRYPGPSGASYVLGKIALDAGAAA